MMLDPEEEPDILAMIEKHKRRRAELLAKQPTSLTTK
jgi:hypothetical protein